jgi:hypothetical protein
VGSDRGQNVQINAVVDAVHCHIQTKGTAGKLTIMIGKREKPNQMAEILNATAILVNNLEIPLAVKVLVDNDPKELTAMTTFSDDREWMAGIHKLNNETPPEIALSLSNMVSDNSFRWYKSVKANYWSGRIEGLQVCTVSEDGKNCVLDVGKPGKNGDIGKAREVFLKLAQGKQGPFNRRRVPEVAATIKILAESRRNGDLREILHEPLLESMVLREKVIITSKCGKLIPVCKTYPFQFPALWSPNGQAKFIDALMCIDETPYVIELKAPKNSSSGQYYRHAITQAVLYREFIKTATMLHPWFFDKKLDPLKCKAAIAFPRMEKKPKQQMLLKQHKDVAKAFGVEVIEIDDFN